MMKLVAAGILAAHLVAFPGCDEPTVRLVPPGMVTVECASAAPARLAAPGKAALDLFGTRAIAELATPEDDGTVAVSVAVEIGDGFVNGLCDVPGRGQAARVFFLLPTTL